ncbi:alpha/beta fold hydrolase [Hirschia baltica]|uniref:Transcriptional regulator, CadC n=1 Tax=Hirschia baltica (strain ATCC 49814 / DSM 5838 / IFAM 1418) TaxID=582402 RepID=C6XRJ0_HIRBI|nr:alpha/beta fold hydrolase [Hirschia baltica]ACT58822.1 transcriptional regulator, CadC [Hirschia baltica ATCC 49814]
MEPSKQNTRVFKFGEFVLDRDLGTITFEGDDLKLRPKAYEFLSLLVEGRGRLFSKEELLETLWPHVFATEESLARVVSTCRCALGDEEKTIIVTIPKRGYRIGLPVFTDKDDVAERQLSEVKYAQSGDISIAYQTSGLGPSDLIYIPAWVTHLEYGWEPSRLSAFYDQLSAFSRLILFDKRGTGLSDRSFGLPNLDERIDDVRAVIAATGSEKISILATCEGSALGIAFAAMFPEKVDCLILDGAFAKREWSKDYPWAPNKVERQTFYDEIKTNWGGPIGVESIAPSLASDQDFCRWWATYQRRSASPAAAMSLAETNTIIDVREYLPLIRVPTLVMHRVDDTEVYVEEGRYIASQISNSRLIEMPGGDHAIFAEQRDLIVEEIHKFMITLGLAGNLS